MKSYQYIHQELDYLKRETENRSPELVLICGEMNFSVMSNAIDIISEKLKKLAIKQAKITKAKLLTTELIQNVFKHGQKKQHQR
jgi:two-component sensor histidine kinase